MGPDEGERIPEDLPSDFQFTSKRYALVDTRRNTVLHTAKPHTTKCSLLLMQPLRIADTVLMSPYWHYLEIPTSYNILHLKQSLHLPPSSLHSLPSLNWSAKGRIAAVMQQGSE
jgi:hypothetical protein